MLDRGCADKLQETMEDMEARGPGWRRRFGKAMERLAAQQPGVSGRFASEVAERSSMRP